jgi:hypothetical protein
MSTQHVPRPPLWRRFLSLPKTHLGWWSVALSGVSVVLLLIAFVVIAFDEYPLPVVIDWSGWITIQILTMFLSGLASVVVGLIAVLIGRERSWLVWLAMVIGPASFKLLMLLRELNLDPYRRYCY